MICPRCLLRRSTRHKPTTHLSSRPFTTHPSLAAQAVTAQTTTATNPRPNDIAAATSTSAAQPFTESMTYSPARTPDLPIQRSQTKQPAARPPSSAPAGTPLKGLNSMKNKQDPVALEDSEYPDWLWGVLDKKGDGDAASSADSEGDLFSKSKKQRRLAAKALRKQQLLNPELLQAKIPLYEQSIDLPGGDGTEQGAIEAAHSRQELTSAMREHRRAKIKEANFLKGMR